MRAIGSIALAQGARFRCKDAVVSAALGALTLLALLSPVLIDWSPTRYLPDVKPWVTWKWSQGLDEQYMAMSVITPLAFLWILHRFGNASWSEAARPDEEGSPATVSEPSRLKPWQQAQRANSRRRRSR